MLVRADTHVHYYQHFDFHLFLASANRNFSKNIESCYRIIFLTETENEHFFNDLRSGKYSEFGSVISTKEEVSIIFESFEFGIFIFIAGFQYASQEKLEVLSLGAINRLELDNRIPFSNLVARLSERGEFLILPWGVGKWLFSRGRLIKDVFNQGNVMLADSAMRFIGFPKPRVLSSNYIFGTDPNPVRGEEYIVGRCGIEINLQNEDDLSAILISPFAILKNKIQNNQFTVYGKRRSILEFLRTLN